MFDTCLYILDDGSEDQYLLATHVDDLAGTGTQGGFDKTVRCLKGVFEIKIMREPRVLLGVVIERDRSNKKMSLHQGPYIKRLIDDLGVKNCHPPKTPMEAGAQAELRKGLVMGKVGTLGRESEYQSIVGKLMWLFKTR